MTSTSNPSFNLNGLAVRRMPPMVKGHPGTIFIPLPPEAWRETGPCSCDVCKARGGRSYWDTLAVSAGAPQPPKTVLDDWTWTVHYPELHTEESHKREDERRDALEVTP